MCHDIILVHWSRLTHCLAGAVYSTYEVDIFSRNDSQINQKKNMYYLVMGVISYSLIKPAGNTKTVHTPLCSESLLLYYTTLKLDLIFEFIS